VKLSTNSKRSRSRAVGENVAVPRPATPLMLTAGPCASLTGVVLAADARQKDSRLADRDFLHLSFAQAGGV
jgi:hypothetical protein